MQSSQNGPKICLLLAAERSGTHFLRSMLAQAPGVAAPVEICNPTLPDITTSPTSYLTYKANAIKLDERFSYLTSHVQTELLNNYITHIRSIYNNKKYVILDIKYSHVHNFQPAWAEFVDRPFILNYAIQKHVKIIHLVRHKPYRNIISNFFAEKSGIWHLTENAANNRIVNSFKINVDRAALEAKALRLCETINLFGKWLSGCDVATISYEDLSNETAKCLARLRDHLGLGADIPAHSQYMKSTPPYSETIVNYSEIADLIDLELSEIKYKPTIAIEYI